MGKVARAVSKQVRRDERSRAGEGKFKESCPRQGKAAYGETGRGKVRGNSKIYVLGETMSRLYTENGK